MRNVNASIQRQEFQKQASKVCIIKMIERIFRNLNLLICIFLNNNKLKYITRKQKRIPTEAYNYLNSLPPYINRSLKKVKGTLSDIILEINVFCAKRNFNVISFQVPLCKPCSEFHWNGKN